MILRRHPGRLLLSLPLCLAVIGCGDLTTFSHISREQGAKDLAAGDYDQAEGAYSDAVRQNPRDYESFAQLGYLFARKGQYARSLASYKQALEVQPLSTKGQNDPDFRIRTLMAQADVMAKVHDGDATVNDLESKAATSSTGEESFQLARIYEGRGDADSALAAYNRAAAQAPGQFYIAKAQGLFLARIGQKAEAETALRRAYRLYDKDAEVAAALRSLGVVPGPSLKDEGQLQKPVLPVGPIPDYLHRNGPTTPANGPQD